MPDVGKYLCLLERALQPFVSVPGSVISRESLFEDRIIQRKNSHQLLEPGVFPLQFFKVFDLVHLHPAVLLTPFVIGAVTDAQLSAELLDRTTGGDFGISFSKHFDNLFWAVNLLFHSGYPFQKTILVLSDTL